MKALPRVSWNALSEVCVAPTKPTNRPTTEIRMIHKAQGTQRDSWETRSWSGERSYADGIVVQPLPSPIQQIHSIHGTSAGSVAGNSDKYLTKRKGLGRFPDRNQTPQLRRPIL